MKLCPCGTQLEYSNCCEVIHQDHQLAQTPLQLMRARYCAHVLGLTDFVIETYHPSRHAESQRVGIEESINSQWIKLDVLCEEDGVNENEGFVTFKAHFIDDEQQYCLEERSRFVRENALWYYIDGEFPTATVTDPRLEQTVSSLKVGRNDPCLCGSGKKFKKCCG